MEIGMANRTSTASKGQRVSELALLWRTLFCTILALALAIALSRLRRI
jgi:hypothetical protein